MPPYRSCSLNAVGFPALQRASTHRVATGAGAEMRRAVGVAVFAGMLGVTLFGLILTPVAYYLVRRWRTPSVASVTRRAVPQLCRRRRRWALGGGWK